MSKKSVLAIVFYLALVFADTGGSGATFLTLDTGARNLGMAGSGSAFANGVQSLCWNPAVLGWLNGKEIICSHSEHFQSIRYENIGFAYGRNNTGLGFSLKGLYLGGIEERTEPSPEPISMMNAYFLAPTLSLGRVVSRYFTLGMNIKSVYQQIGDDNSFSFATDMGVDTKTPVKGMKTGLSIIDLGTGVKFTRFSYSLPTRLRLGLGYSLADGNVNLALDLIKFLKEDLEYAMGIEGRMIERLSLRLGYRGTFNGEDNYGGLACGFGVQVQNFDVDYAFTTNGSLGGTHTFSISYFWGRSERVKAERGLLIAEEFMKRIKYQAQEFYNQGLAAKNNGMDEEAIKNFETSLIWNSDFREPVPYIEALKKNKFNRCLQAGYNAYKGNDYIEAIYQFSCAARIDSTDKNAQGWLKASLAALVKATSEKISEKTKRERISYYIQSGGECFSKKDYKEAIRQWHNALAIDSTQISVRRFIEAAKIKIRDYIQVLIEQKRLFKALGRVKEYLSLEPENQEFLDKKAYLEKELNNLTLAHIDNGIRFFNRGSYLSSKVEFRIVHLLEPQNFTAKHYLAKINSLRIEPNTIELNNLYEKGAQFYAQGNYEFALECYEGIKEFKPDFFGVQKNIELIRKKIAEN